jgi:hypothetical protein
VPGREIRWGWPVVGPPPVGLLSQRSGCVVQANHTSRVQEPDASTAGRTESDAVMGWKLSTSTDGTGADRASVRPSSTTEYNRGPSLRRGVLVCLNRSGAKHPGRYRPRPLPLVLICGASRTPRKPSRSGRATPTSRQRPDPLRWLAGGCGLCAVRVEPTSRAGALDSSRHRWPEVRVGGFCRHGALRFRFRLRLFRFLFRRH